MKILSLMTVAYLCGAGIVHFDGIFSTLFFFTVMGILGWIAGDLEQQLPTTKRK